MDHEINSKGIASTFIGTTIGAGFASGQELMQFFAVHGINGIIGTVFVGVSFSALAAIMMLTARANKVTSYEEVAAPDINILRWLVNAMITFFSYGLIVVMIAGTGSLVHTITGLPALTGNILMAVLVLMVSWSGSGGMLNSFNIVVPLMIAIAVVTGMAGIMNGTDELKSITAASAQAAVSGNWIFSASIFVSYNMSAALAVLVPLGTQTKNKKSIITGSLIGGMVLGFASALLCMALLKNISYASMTELPLLAIARAQNNLLGTAYMFVLIAGIFTTAVGLMFALTERLQAYRINVLKNRKLVIIFITVTSVIASNFGFSKLIGVLYPLNGYMGFLIIFGVLYNFIRTLKRRR